MMERNRTIDILKGICMLFIIINHSSWEETERLRLLFPFTVTMAVPILMFISGFLNARSFEKKQIVSITDCYKKSVVVPRLTRLIVPFTMMYFLEVCIHLIFSPKMAYEYVLMYLCGGWGDGTYYVPVMIQFVFSFPLIYFLIKWNKKKGLFLSFTLTLLYELIQRAYQMNVECYTNILFRYLFLIASGCYAGLYSESNNRIHILYLIEVAVGLAFIILFSYTPYHTVIFQDYWKSTTLLPSLFVIPIVTLILKYINISIPFFEIIGRASFHIFLVQKVFFYGIKSGIEFDTGNQILQVLLNILCCVVVGIAFYYFERKCYRRIVRHTVE